MKNKDAVHSIRFTAEELKALKEAAEKNGRTFAGHVRWVLAQSIKANK